MNLDKETGITIMKIAEQLDTGPICNTYKINLENNRLHKLTDLEVGLKIANKYIENISLDFIFNLPNQEFKDIEDSIKFSMGNSMNTAEISFKGFARI